MPLPTTGTDLAELAVIVRSGISESRHFNTSAAGSLTDLQILGGGVPVGAIVPGADVENWLQKIRDENR